MGRAGMATNMGGRPLPRPPVLPPTTLHQCGSEVLGGSTQCTQSRGTVAPKQHAHPPCATRRCAHAQQTPVHEHTHTLKHTPWVEYSGKMSRSKPANKGRGVWGTWGGGGGLHQGLPVRNDCMSRLMMTRRPHGVSRAAVAAMICMEAYRLHACATVNGPEAAEPFAVTIQLAPPFAPTLHPALPACTHRGTQAWRCPQWRRSCGSWRSPPLASHTPARGS